jgi:hypothetical protein
MAWMPLIFATHDAPVFLDDAVGRRVQPVGRRDVSPASRFGRHDTRHSEKIRVELKRDVGLHTAIYSRV